MVQSNEVMKTVIQCDFDGTITQEDIGFHLLDNFADRDWRQVLAKYREGKISVGCFNSKAFAMVRADRQTLLDSIKGKVRIRAGFDELLSYCHRWGFRFVIVSNGLDFYIEKILRDIGVENVQVFAARTEFNPRGIEVKYIGPDGNQLQDSFKETHTRLFLSKGYRVIYAGNGISDFSPASQAHYIFATGELLDYCKRMNLGCTPFVDFNDVVKGLELLEQK